MFETAVTCRMLFKCTLKVRKALKLRDQDLSIDIGKGGNEFNHWYCNMFFLDRRKCLIWMHGTTLFTVLAPGVYQNDFRQLGEVFRSRAKAVLAATDGISEANINLLLDEGPDYFAKTDSRSVLGSMNDHILGCKYHAEAGFESIDFTALNYNLNRTPMGAIGYKYASESLKFLLNGEAKG